jgi:hypothetical protein
VYSLCSVAWSRALSTALLHRRRRSSDYLMQCSGSSGTKLLSAVEVVMEVPWRSGTVHTTCSWLPTKMTSWVFYYQQYRRPV